MERRSFVQGAGLAGVLATGMAPAVVHAQANLRWRLTSSFPKSLDTIFGAAEVFARKVKDMTGGKFEISVHAAGELMPSPALVDGVQNGTVEMGHTAPYYYFGKDETFALGCAIPFGLNSRQMTAWAYQGNGLTLMREFYAKYNIMSFPMGNTGAQMGGWYRKEIKTVADLKGLKFRVGGFAGKVMRAHGHGGAEHSRRRDLPGAGKGHHRRGRVGRSLRRPEAGLQQGGAVLLLPGLVGRWSAARPLHQHQGLREPDAGVQGHRRIAAAAFAHTDMQAKYDAKNPAALLKLVQAKTKLIAFPKPVLDLAYKESMALYSEISAKNPACSRRSTTRLCQVPQGRQPVVPLHRSALRQLHAVASSSERRLSLPRRKAPRCGAFFMEALGPKLH